LDVLHKEENDAFLTFVIPQEKEGLLMVIISLSILFISYKPAFEILDATCGFRYH
jgi:hypothetical protein